MDSGESQNKSTQNMSNILSYKELMFCLVCQRGIDHTTDASQHILEDIHKVSVKNLFKICTQDFFCDSVDPRYDEVINNSVLLISHDLKINEGVINTLFDISRILINETKYDISFKCLLCEKTVSSAHDPDEIKRDFVFHMNVERDIHLDYIKHNCSWVYSQDNPKHFIMFHKCIVYCSLCDEVLNYVDNLMLQAAVLHLETSPHQTKLGSTPLVNNVTDKPDSDYNETGDLELIDGSDKESLEIPDNAMLHFENNVSVVSNNFQSASSVKDKPDSVSTGDSVSCDGLDQEFMPLEITDNAQFENNLFNISGNNVLLSTNVTDNPDSIETGDSESTDGLDKEFKSFEITDNARLFLENNLADISNDNLLPCSNVTINNPEPIVTGDSQLVVGIGKELESLEVFDNGMLHFNNNQSDISGNSMLPSSNVTEKTRLIGDLKSLEATGKAPLHFEGSLSEVNVTNNNSEEDDCEDLVEILKDDPLTCPECGETIEIYNNNADFSLRHHSQKHIGLSVVNASFDCDYQKDTDYVCPICAETIPIFNQNLELSIARHFDENNHDQGFSTSEIYNESEFLDNVQMKLPQEHQVHCAFFKLDGNHILCKLCGSILQDSSNNVSSACELITKHISDRYHSDQYKIFSQQLKLTVVSYNKEIVSDPQSLPLQNSMFETLAKNNVHIRNNKDFIEVQKYLYLCKICQKHICYSPNESTLEKNFLLHFNIPFHKYNLKKARKQLTASALGREGQMRKFTSLYNKVRFQKVLSKLAKDTNFSDVKYIEYKSGNFNCHICNVSVSASACGLPVKIHIMGSKHKKQTNLSIVKNERAQRILDQSLKFSDVLKTNLDYIGILNGDFFCSLCKVSIIATSNMSQLKSHFTSKDHFKNFHIHIQPLKSSKK